MIKNITNARDLIHFLEDAIKNGFPILIIVKDIKQDIVAKLIVDNLRCALKVNALKDPGFGESTSYYLDDIMIFTGGISYSFEKVFICHSTRKLNNYFFQCKSS